MQDYILKAISGDLTLRAVIASTTHLVEEARNRHNLSYTATAALGRVLTASALLSCTLSRDGQVALKFMGNGPLGRVVADATPSGTVRGYVENPHVELPLNALGNFDVGAAIGSVGYLQVTVDRGYGMPYISTVELKSGEVGEDVNQYLVNSDQTGSMVIVGVHVSARGVETAGGLIVQLLPDHTEETIGRLEDNVSTFGNITFLMRRGMGPQEILARLLRGFEVCDLGPPTQLRFACRCSQARFVEALKFLGRTELENMAAEEGQAEGRCHFCNEVYHVYRDGLLKLVQG
jgi:molecular chaperone Hsp33